MGDLMNQKEKLVIIVPCYNEQESVGILYDEIMKTTAKPLQDLMIEIVFVDDGSSDNTLHTIKDLAIKHQNVSYISFSRNFGKEAAIYAGLKNANGDYYAVMDADLQDPPHLLEKMYEAVKNQGYDCAAAKRASREGEPKIRAFFAKRFYQIINAISETEIVDGARDYRLMNRRMVNAVLELKEYNRFSKGLFSWVGFRVKWISYENIERVKGSTKWSFGKLFLYAMDGIISFSTMPLKIVSFLGILISLFSIFGIIFIIVRTIIFGDPVAGWPSLVVIMTFIGGLQLLCLGILGQYLAHVYMEVKGRPIYLVQEENISNEV